MYRIKYPIIYKYKICCILCQEKFDIRYRILACHTTYNIIVGGGLSIYDEFTQNRIVALRTQKDVSARDMSLSLGQNDSYINRIENKKSLPSLAGLFYICEYFGITPQEFFDEGNPYPEQLKEIIDDLKLLDGNALTSLSGVIKEMVVKKK